ncbi:hypothetical protein AALP_AA8G417600 [Arabis alpina]|uniref:F-box domain-containing protein n=1 Tax=Arabis alpina TaxID=50452 RepID=A0A087GCV2_ARAAL|nr:hypothetical protein AALP_AA8G417600 [Arabis alpina]
MLKGGIRLAGSLFKAGVAKIFKDLEGQEDYLAMNMVPWTPYLYVNPGDPICAEYIGYFKNKTFMSKIGLSEFERIATKNPLRSLLVGKKGTSSPSDFSTEPLHLLPSAYMTVNKNVSHDRRKAHGLDQWWDPSFNGNMLIPMDTGRTRIPESLLVEIVARLPLRSISRFKSVSKTWKSLIESSYFRRLFVSLHRNSSSSWSLMFRTDNTNPITEAIGFNGCKTWGLPKSLGSYILPFQLTSSHYSYVASSNGLVWIEIFANRTDNMPYVHKSLVGNPVLQQWIEISPPPEPCVPAGLVTRVEEENGVVSSFKVVRTCQSRDRDMEDMYVWRVYVYSSETGLWSFKRLVSSYPLSYTASYNSMNLNGMIYMWEMDLDSIQQPGVLISYDFYGEESDDQCRVIPLPVLYNEHARRCLTNTSGGRNVIYIEILGRILKVWKLNNSFEWRLSREKINMASIECDVDYFPMAMNPFDSDIVYLWSRQHCCMVTGNLKKQEFIIHQDLEDWSSGEGCYRVNTLDSKSYMEANRNVTSVLMLSQFVLPKWMDSVPRMLN